MQSDSTFKLLTYLCILNKMDMAKRGEIHPSRIFKTVDALQEAWDGYKNWLHEESKKWIKVQYVGKEGDRKTDAQKVPLTMEGFERYCYDNYGNVEQYFKNQDGYYESFIPICSRIKKEIREDQIIGGLLGFYNTSITQRLNGLTDKQENNVTIKTEQPLFGD